MKKEEAKQLMFQAWMKLPNGKIGEMDRCNTNFGLIFFSYIENHYPELLSFVHPTDKYQIVKTWVEEWQRGFCN